MFWCHQFVEKNLAKCIWCLACYWYLTDDAYYSLVVTRITARAFLHDKIVKMISNIFKILGLMCSYSGIIGVLESNCFVSLHNLDTIKSPATPLFVQRRLKAIYRGKHKISVSPILCEGNPPVIGGFPSQRTSNAGTVFPYHDIIMIVVASIRTGRTVTASRGILCLPLLSEMTSRRRWVTPAVVSWHCHLYRPLS